VTGNVLPFYFQSRTGGDLIPANFEINSRLAGMTVKGVFTRLSFGVMIRIVEEYGKHYFKMIFIVAPEQLV
jgi:hypothetical protein